MMKDYFTKVSTNYNSSSALSNKQCYVQYMWSLNTRCNFFCEERELWMENIKQLSITQLYMRKNNDCKQTDHQAA
jgi:hypothetical protein